MNKKILDVVAVCFFSVSLIAAANVEERTNHHVLSGDSFTTESDEETGISKNQVTRVATQKSDKSDEMVTEYDREDKAEEQEQESIPAGLAEPINPETATEETMLTLENRWNITLSEDEINLLAKIVWLESCGEPQEGQEAVVEVIFNRMASDKYPDTLYDVLSQQHPVQFCSWKNREIAKPTEKEYQSIHNVLDGKTNILRNDTLYFSTEPLTPNLDHRIGGHSFCY